MKVIQGHRSISFQGYTWSLKDIPSSFSVSNRKTNKQIKTNDIHNISEILLFSHLLPLSLYSEPSQNTHDVSQYKRQTPKSRKKTQLSSVKLTQRIPKGGNHVFSWGKLFCSLWVGAILFHIKMMMTKMTISSWDCHEQTVHSRCSEFTWVMVTEWSNLLLKLKTC